jgi:Fe-S-cluster containining protein
MSDEDKVTGGEEQLEGRPDGEAEAGELDREQDMEVEIFDGVRGQDGNPVQPVRLDAGDTFCFSCHRGVSCWNECCHGADITLTPYDILRLSGRLDMRPAEFLLNYTVPAMWPQADLPVAKLKMTGEKGEGPCAFMREEGCSVYEDRPATCRYYPLGLISAKPKGADEQEDFNFLVKESHCKGHDEKKEQTVGQYRIEQGVDDYDRVNRGWIDILMKMASWRSLGGPSGKETSAAHKRMFFMATTDVDQFRRFVFETKFLDTYEIDPEVVDVLREDDITLLQLAFDWLKNVLFNEPTIALRPHVLQAAMAKAREEMGAT